MGISTLLHLAKEHGFDLSQASATPNTTNPESLAQREHERLEAQQSERARIEFDNANAANL